MGMTRATFFIAAALVVTLVVGAAGIGAYLAVRHNARATDGRAADRAPADRMDPAIHEPDGPAATRAAGPAAGIAVEATEQTIEPALVSEAGVDQPATEAQPALEAPRARPAPTAPRRRSGGPPARSGAPTPPRPRGRRATGAAARTGGHAAANGAGTGARRSRSSAAGARRPRPARGRWLETGRSAGGGKGKPGRAVARSPATCRRCRP